MQLQFVYGNPIKGSKRSQRRKRGLASGRKVNKNKKKEEVVVAKKRKAKKARKSAKSKSRRRVKRAKPHKARKVARKHTKARRKGKKKNPERFKLTFKKQVGVTAKGKKKYRKLESRRTAVVATAGEIQTRRGLSRVAKERSLSHKKRSKARRLYASASKRIGTSAKKAQAKRKAVTAHIQTARLAAKEARQKLTVNRERFPVVAKRKGKKRKSASRSRRSSGRKTRRNPIFGGNMQETIKRAVTGGMDTHELGGLALGGVLYPIMTAGVAKFLPAVYTKLQALKIPGGAGVGANFLLGAIAYAVGDKLNNNIAKAVGKGLIASAAVGAAATAGGMIAQKVLPSAGTAPVGELPDGMYGDIDTEDYGQSDFGNDGADFGGVDYTMEGVDYTMEGVDYTMEGQLGDDGADFGELPEGMGDGQLG